MHLLLVSRRGNEEPTEIKVLIDQSARPHATRDALIATVTASYPVYYCLGYKPRIRHLEAKG